MNEEFNSAQLELAAALERLYEAQNSVDLFTSGTLTGARFEFDNQQDFRDLSIPDFLLFKINAAAIEGMLTYRRALLNEINGILERMRSEVLKEGQDDKG